MPTLKEIKGRISSVQNTLKITSAMKLVSSAKLRKAQGAIESMRPYADTLESMLGSLSGETSSPSESTGGTLIIAIASNSSLCGGFNSNAIAKAKELISANPGADIWPVGRKMADALRKAGYPAGRDLSAVAEHPSYSAASDLVQEILDKGSYTRVMLVYTHFVSTARQIPVAEELPAPYTGKIVSVDEDTITEPSPSQLYEALYPKSLKMKLFAALLDSAAAEHAARTVAMQTATDNGEELLSALTLQYNKGRQQKITNEILDLAGGQNR